MKRKSPSEVRARDGRRYVAVVLQVIESDGRGPRVFRRLHDDESVDVKDEMAFWIVYASEDVTKDRRH